LRGRAMSSYPLGGASDVIDSDSESDAES
jgi:hypothetical protein